MDKRILSWLRNNVGKTFESPRQPAFGQNVFPLRIVSLDQKPGHEKVKIEFVGGKVVALPLLFWMFDRALIYLERNAGKPVRLGARVKPPYDPDTIEGKIWEKPCPYSASYKVSPHVCDILVLTDVAKYGHALNPKTQRNVQAIKYVGIAEGPIKTAPAERVEKTTDAKSDFVSRHKNSIIEWTEKNEDKIISGRHAYGWKNKSTLQCVKERNDLSKAIIQSRIRNSGGVDLDALDKIAKWGFGIDFPLRDPEGALNVTRDAFTYLDNGNLKEAVKILLALNKVGISLASKVIGLFDQENLCVYDSRVGAALRDLKYGNKRMILVPPGRGRAGDSATDNRWAENYEKLIWNLEIVRDYLNEKGCTFRIADVEMALFMMGK